MRIKIESNTVDLKRLVKDATDKFKEYMVDEVTLTADNIKTKADARASLIGDKGFLKGSIYKVQNGLNQEVGATVHYAPYVEFGTGTMHDIPVGLEEYAMQFKANPQIRQVNLPARPFLFNSAFEEINLMIQRLQNGVK